MLQLLYDETVALFPNLNTAQRSRFRRKLLQWFEFYKRDLPWRSSRESYAVWVSEIMLQQTRVTVVAERYVQFMRRFPTASELAAASLDDVLALWSGLGYYRRARMMHQAAQKIVSEHDGVLPRGADEWRALPGVGRYTAAAIASIAADEAVAVVDGNVERVLTRLCGQELTSQQAWTVAGELLSRSHPGDFNQAMMELGATICTPKSPACLMCPVRDFCGTRGTHQTTPRASRKKRDVAYALMARRGKVALIQREANQPLMAGMWELPSAQVNGEAPLMTVKHAITTTDYTVRVFATKPGREESSHLRWFGAEELPGLPLTGLARKVLRRAGIIQ